MRKKLKTLKAKGGHSQNGAPRSLIDFAFYNEKRNNRNVHTNTGDNPHYDSDYSGFSHASRPKDSAVSLRFINPISD